MAWLLAAISISTSAASAEPIGLTCKCVSVQSKSVGGCPPAGHAYFDDMNIDIEHNFVETKAGRRQLAAVRGDLVFLLEIHEQSGERCDWVDTVNRKTLLAVSDLQCRRGGTHVEERCTIVPAWKFQEGRKF